MGKVYVCLRYDDFGLREEALEYDKRLIRMADETEGRITISIVPHSINCKKNRDFLFDDAFQRALSNGKVEVAMHGYKHGSGILERLLRVQGEFGKKPYFMQKRDIENGLKEWKCDLKLPDTDIFVPPYNVYDAKTAKVLKDNGFSIVSDGEGSTKAFENAVSEYGILRVPFTCGIEASKEIAQNLIKEDGEYIIVALFHHYNYPIESVLELADFFAREDNAEFITLKEITGKINKKILSETELEKGKYYKID